MLASGEWDVDALAPSPDGSKIAYTVNEDGSSRLFLRDTASGTSTPVSDLPAGVVSGLAWSPDGSRLAFAVNGARTPSCIWAIDTGGATQEVVRSATTQRLPDSLRQPETIRYPTFDGLQIPAFWFRPKATDGKVPVVVYVHGGTGKSAYDWSSPRLPSIWWIAATRCWLRTCAAAPATVSTTTTWTTARGGRTPSPTWQPLLSGCGPSRRSMPNRDRGDGPQLRRLHGPGGLTSYPDLWAAGVDIVGIADFESFFQRTGPWRRQMRADEYGDPERDAAMLREHLATA